MLIATESRVYSLGRNTRTPALLHSEGTVRRVAQGAAHSIVAGHDATIVVLSEGIARTIDTGVEETIHSLLLMSETPLHLLIGTEPAFVYELRDSGPAVRNESFAALECRDSWHTPWGGPAAVRSMAASPDGWVYADIHVGSIMRSPDRGATWEPVTAELHEDVHQVASCRACPGRVYANTARAVYVSDDRGWSWRHRADQLDARYGRAVAVHPHCPECILATVSDGPHGDNVHGQLWRSEDGGRSWEHVTEGFPAATERNIDTFHLAVDADGKAWAVVGSDLYVGRERARQWEVSWQAPEPIVMLAGAV